MPGSWTSTCTSPLRSSLSASSSSAPASATAGTPGQRPNGSSDPYCRALLAGDAKRLVADYSTGMRKKAALGCALIHNPPVLFLDEPLEGVDPVSGDVIRRLLTRFVGSGSTVLFSSHVMELVEQVCDHVSIIDKGKIVVTGTIDEVRGGKTLQRAFIDLVGPRATDEEVLSWLGSSSSRSCACWSTRCPRPIPRRSLSS